MSRCYCIGGNPCPCVKQQQEGFLSKIIETKGAKMSDFRTEKEKLEDTKARELLRKYHGDNIHPDKYEYGKNLISFVLREMESYEDINNRSKNDMMKEMAIQQFTGYLTGSQGYGVMELVNSMGLTQSEWLKIRDELTLSSYDKDKLDEHFNVSVK